MRRMRAKQLHNVEFRVYGIGFRGEVRGLDNLTMWNIWFKE
jgi:hypothetical protein